MPSRREFLYQLGVTSLGIAGIHVLPGCEHIDVVSKISGGRVEFLTPAEDGTWYWQSGNTTEKKDAPDIARDNWTLSVESDAGLSKTIGFSDLKSMEENGESMAYIKTMRCVFGAKIGTLFDSLVSTGVFKGIPLYKVLRQFNIPQNAKKLRTFGADGFESNLRMDRALEDGKNRLPALLAYELNGQPVSRLRGGPVRLVVPEMWGYKNMKWLEKIVATKDDSIFGTYETERFAPSADKMNEKQKWMEQKQTQRLIDDPARIALTSTVSKPAVNGQEIKGPDVTIAGTSYVGSAPIQNVEISLDDGPFEEIELLSQEDVRATLSSEFKDVFDEAEQTGDGAPWPPTDVWTVWSKTFEGVSKGSHKATIRAKDGEGRQQKGNTGNMYEVAPQVLVEFTVK